MKKAIVIMAGGKGERFWPQSRSHMPKQFLSLTGDGITMIQHTVRRLESIVSKEDMFVVTNKEYREIVLSQLPDIPEENVLAEPIARNTAPCIAFASAVIREKYGDAIMLVLPSDHLIKNSEMFIKTLQQAIDKAGDGENLVTIGITPSYPETGYGYINFMPNPAHGSQEGVYSAKRFVEKPDKTTAKEYLASGAYLWNSGMFIWKTSTILKYFYALLPDMSAGIEKIGEAFGTASFEKVVSSEFQKFPSVSIDYGVMEKVENIYVIPGNFGWDDVGSWLALERFNAVDENNNMLQGDTVALDCKNTTIRGSNRLIAAIGLQNLIVIDTDDVMLICSKESAQDVKKVIAALREKNRDELI